MYITHRAVYDTVKTENPCHARFAVYDFAKTYVFGKEIARAELTVSADTAYRLSVNGKMFAGPVSAGGDFLLDVPPSRHFADRIVLENQGDRLVFSAVVKRGARKGTEHTRGVAAFSLSCNVTFADGSSETAETDESWLARYDGRYISPSFFDGRIKYGEWEHAAVCSDIWRDEILPLENLTEEKVFPVSGGEIRIPAHSSAKATAEYDKIYSAYGNFTVLADGCCEIKAVYRELPGNRAERISVITQGDTEYRTFAMFSVGMTELEITNHGDREAVVRPYITYTRYPVHSKGSFVCGNADVNRVAEVCAHTLEMCRQTIHLDSPMHQEPLACTGDYNIEMHMEAFAFGDLTLSKCDIIRTADLLTSQDGRMFHTTYSLIFVGMLLDYYMYSGDVETVKYCEGGLRRLFGRFETYRKENGLTEGPDYMFVDWIVVDGYSMHHPPKALGQTVLCAFHYGALINGAKIFGILGDNAYAAGLTAQAKALKEAINKELFDSEKGLYFAGSAGESEGIYHYLPQNSKKRYFLAHGNVLCAMYGIADDKLSESIMRRVMSGEMPDYQPYFAHYVFEALHRTGLYEEYAPTLIARWIPVVKACGKGLAEGWIKPQPDYVFDHSHAWGGTVLYQLYRHSLGLEILAPGMKRICLRPKDLGLGNTDISVPTPYGELRMSRKDGGEPQFTVPDGIEVVPVVDVAAALIRDGGRFMICQRPTTKTRPLQWEFVGGKREPGETLEETLMRECREELNVTVKPLGVFAVVYHDYPDIKIRLTLFNAEIAEGVPEALEHNAIGWITPSQIKDYSFCPADKDILEKIKAEW